jgi:anti-sigma factor RsiW
MTSTDRLALMHAMLDGQASPAETAALKRLMAQDPTAQAEYEQLEVLFHGLRDLPQPHPPEGMVAAIGAAIPRYDQLSAGSRVLDASPTLRSDPMTQPTGSSPTERPGSALAWPRLH